MTIDKFNLGGWKGGIRFMWIEILITLMIVAFAGYIIYKNLKTTSTGNCGCGNCSTKQKK